MNTSSFTHRNATYSPNLTDLFSLLELNDAVLNFRRMHSALYYIVHV